MESLAAAPFASLGLSKGNASLVSQDSKEQAAAEISDEILLAKVSAGDQEALGILFRRYARLVWSVAERIVRNKAEADDLVQDVFLLVQRRASAFDSSKGTARSLIVHMTYQRALSRKRYLNARHRQASAETEKRAANTPGPAVPFYDESIEAHFGRDRLQKAFEALSEDQRQTLRLYFLEGYTLAEIAAKMGQVEGNVKHHYYRGLSKLRSSLR